MSSEAAFAIGFVVGFCTTVVRLTMGLYEVDVKTALIFSGFCFASMAIVLSIAPPYENSDALLAYITASAAGFTLMGGSLLGRFLLKLFTR